MTEQLLKQTNKVRIIGNSSNWSPNPKGLTGSLYGYTPSGNPIVGLFHPGDGDFHTWEFSQEDVEVDE